MALNQASKEPLVLFEKYVAFQTGQGHINTFDECANIFVLSQADIA